MKSFKQVTEAQEAGDCPCGSEYPEDLKTKMKKGKPEIVKEGEANYGGDYQAMVLRVKEKARQQAERKKQQEVTSKQNEQDKEKAKDATDPNSDRFTSGPAKKPTQPAPIVKANESYEDNRRGFKRREREDDEYHVPDPTVKKLKEQSASKIGEPEDDVPFDKPYHTVKDPVVKDKSGAQHNPMSRARDLARKAAQRQAGLKKESLEESRKAEIVKEIMKGKKKQTAEKFEPNPELQSTVVKSDN